MDGLKVFNVFGHWNIRQRQFPAIMAKFSDKSWTISIGFGDGQVVKCDFAAFKQVKL
jgi:hypothetical protein